MPEIRVNVSMESFSDKALLAELMERANKVDSGVMNYDEEEGPEHPVFLISIHGAQIMFMLRDDDLVGIQGDTYDRTD